MLCAQKLVNQNPSASPKTAKPGKTKNVLTRLVILQLSKVNVRLILIICLLCAHIHVATSKVTQPIVKLGKMRIAIATIVNSELIEEIVISTQNT